MLSDRVREAKELYARMEACYPHVRWEPEQFFMDLVEEVGELANALLCVRGAKFAHRQKADLGDSFFDVLFDLLLLADRMGVDLDAEWERGLTTFARRLESGEFDPA